MKDRQIPKTKHATLFSKSGLFFAMTVRRNSVSMRTHEYVDSKGGLWHIQPNWHGFGPPWEYYHDSYDGAPDAHDKRCGYGESPSHCRICIESFISQVAIDQTLAEIDRETHQTKR